MVEVVPAVIVSNAVLIQVGPNAGRSETDSQTTPGPRGNGVASQPKSVPPLPRGNREFRSCRSGPSPSVLSCASYSTSSATAGLEASAAQAEIGPIETDEEVCEKVSLHRHQISSKPNSGNFGASEPSGPTSFDFRSGDIIMTLLSRSDILYTGG